MDVIEAILTRRSIRKYTNQPVPAQVMEDLLLAAMNAPSAGNGQPWHFIVVKDKKVMQAMMAVHPHAAMLEEASVAIVVCADEKLEKYKGFWPQDCSAATINVLLTAHAHGLGAVWVGVYPDEERVRGVRAALRAPEHIHPFSIIPMGFPAEQKPAKELFSSDRIHHDVW
ncbi:MAG: nitroreductase family protein [bacterium]